MGKKWKQWQTSFSWALKSLLFVTAAMKLNGACSLEEKLWKPREHIKKQSHHFANKSPPSQSYDFSSSHGQIWELDNKEVWVPKNWYFWTAVLKKSLESPLHFKIKPVNPKRNRSWIFIGRTDGEAEASIFWPPDANWPIWKDPDAGEVWR